MEKNPHIPLTYAPELKQPAIELVMPAQADPATGHGAVTGAPLSSMKWCCVDGLKPSTLIALIVETGVPTKWATGDRVYDQSCRLHTQLEAHRMFYPPGDGLIGMHRH